jgi:hypothetical protein
VAVDPERLYSLKKAVLELQEQASALVSELQEGRQTILVCIEENKAKQADIRKVKEIFKL